MARNNLITCLYKCILTWVCMYVINWLSFGEWMSYYAQICINTLWQPLSYMTHFPYNLSSHAQITYFWLLKMKINGSKNRDFQLIRQNQLRHLLSLLGLKSIGLRSVIFWNSGKFTWPSPSKSTPIACLAWSSMKDFESMFLMKKVPLHWTKRGKKCTMWI